MEEENLILIVDFERICRLCLQSTGAMSNIFVDNDGRLKDMIHCVIGIEIQECDNLPSNICHKCRHIVELNCDLRAVALKSQALLKQTSNEILAEEYLHDKEPVTSTQSSEDILHDNLTKDVMPHPQTVNFERETKHQPPSLDTSQNQVHNATANDLTCQLCLREFTTPDYLEKHCTSHYETSPLTPIFKLKRPYKCEICNIYVGKKQLVHHHRSHLNINPFVCSEPNCNYVGKNKDYLRRHSQVHSARGGAGAGAGRHMCAVCGATFPRRGSLRQHHARAHSAPRSCSQCGVHCKNDLTYAAHMASHEKGPRHACTFPGCSKAYFSRHAAAAHARTHADRRDYKCTLCVATYTTQSLLNRHIRQHASGRARRCDRCWRVFGDYAQFYLHRVQQHGPWRPHKCSCGARFAKEGHLDKHQLKCQVAICMQANPRTSDSCDDMKPEEIVAEICINKLQQDEPTDSHDVYSEFPSDELLYIEVETEDI